MFDHFVVVFTSSIRFLSSKNDVIGLRVTSLMLIFFFPSQHFYLIFAPLFALILMQYFLVNAMRTSFFFLLVAPSIGIRWFNLSASLLFTAHNDNHRHSRSPDCTSFCLFCHQFIDGMHLESSRIVDEMKSNVCYKRMCGVCIWSKCTRIANYVHTNNNNNCHSVRIKTNREENKWDRRRERMNTKRDTDRGKNGSSMGWPKTEEKKKCHVNSTEQEKCISAELFIA